MTKLPFEPIAAHFAWRAYLTTVPPHRPPRIMIVEIISGAIVAVISGSSRRTLGVFQVCAGFRNAGGKLVRILYRGVSSYIG